MNAPEPLELAAHWLAIALGDLQAAEQLLGDLRLPARQAAGHAQQAAEKALKGAIVATGKAPPWTHDLEVLGPFLPATSRFHALDVRLARLSEAYSATRYPTYFEPDFGHDEAARLVSEAAAIVNAILDDFAALGLDRPAPR